MELLSNTNNLSRYPEDEEMQYLAYLDLHEQIRQVYTNEKVNERIEFREFAMFTAFINKCAI